MNCKCKPTYQFQSVEFDYFIDDSIDVKDKDIDKMLVVYEKVLKGLMRIAPVQDTKQLPKEPLATEKQKEIMNAYGIKYTATTTQKEAYEKIKKSMDQ